MKPTREQIHDIVMFSLGRQEHLRGDMVIAESYKDTFERIENFFNESEKTTDDDEKNTESKRFSF